VDIGTPVGTPLYVIGRPNPDSAFGGFADVFCSIPSSDDTRGYAAYVKTPDFPDIEFVYYHLKPLSCASGRLNTGSKFAETGSSGNVTGPHLHFETKLRGDWSKLDFREERFEPKRWQVQWTLEGKEPSKDSAPTVASSEVEAFLLAIRHAEGTNSKKAYTTMFTGKQFSDLSKHPEQVNCTIGPDGKDLCSAAAGAYQYMPKTWARISKKINAADFSPENQERGAVELLKERGAFKLIQEGKIETAFTYVCEEWASVSCYTHKTKGAYPNQAVKPISELMEVYRKALKK
jgi:muramidase (phage lysozyme)